jgi:excisionase family DNA binding protein
MQNGTCGPLNGSARYSVAEAAELLGITARAVRKRIVAGRLPAERTPHGWAIVLGAEPAAAPGEPSTAPREPHPAPGEPARELAALRAHVVWLEAELRRLLAVALQTPALPAPAAPLRPWWAQWVWWRR